MGSEVPAPRHHAAGGWRRAVMGLLVGVGFGAWVTRVVPADRAWPPEGARELARAWWGSTR